MRLKSTVAQTVKCEIYIYFLNSKKLIYLLWLRLQNIKFKSTLAQIVKYKSTLAQIVKYKI